MQVPAGTPTLAYAFRENGSGEVPAWTRRSAYPSY